MCFFFILFFSSFQCECVCCARSWSSLYTISISSTAVPRLVIVDDADNIDWCRRPIAWGLTSAHNLYIFLFNFSHVFVCYFPLRPMPKLMFNIFLFYFFNKNRKFQVQFCLFLRGAPKNKNSRKIVVFFCVWMRERVRVDGGFRIISPFCANYFHFSSREYMDFIFGSRFLQAHRINCKSINTNASHHSKVVGIDERWRRGSRHILAQIFFHVKNTQFSCGPSIVSSDAADSNVNYYLSWWRRRHQRQNLYNLIDSKIRANKNQTKWKCA